jgi:hypothetical protein
MALGPVRALTAGAGGHRHADLATFGFQGRSKLTCQRRSWSISALAVKAEKALKVALVLADVSRDSRTISKFSRGRFRYRGRMYGTGLSNAGRWLTARTPDFRGLGTPDLVRHGRATTRVARLMLRSGTRCRASMKRDRRNGRQATPVGTREQ